MTSVFLGLATVFTATFLPVVHAAPTPPTLADVPPPLDFNYQPYILDQLNNATIGIPAAQAQVNQRTTGSFYGCVKDKNTGQPIAKATITAQAIQDFANGTGVTDSVGCTNFQINNMLINGAFTVTASASGYAPSTADYSSAAGSLLNNDFNLQPVATGGFFEICAIDPKTHAPVVGATVDIYPTYEIWQTGQTTETPLWTGTTGNDGCVKTPNMFQSDHDYGLKITQQGYPLTAWPITCYRYRNSPQQCATHYNIVMATCADNPRLCATPTPTPTLPPPTPTVRPTPTPSPTPTPIPTPTTQPQLEVFVNNDKVCTAKGDTLPYRLVARNTGGVTLKDITIQFKYPAGTSFLNSDPKPDQEIPDDHLVEYYIPSLAPGAVASYSVIITVDGDINSALVNVTAFYFDDKGNKQPTVMTDHIINGSCSPKGIQTTPAPSGTPAIVCARDNDGKILEQVPTITTDPQTGQQTTVMKDCVDTFNTLKLGKNYQAALDPAKQPVICSPTDPTNCVPRFPDLGPNFIEGVADIMPGECRVFNVKGDQQGDNIIEEQAYQNALNRRGKPAAAYMQPLYNSDQDFKQMVTTDQVLGIQQLAQVTDQVSQIHRNNWSQFVDLMNSVNAGTTAPEQALGQYDQFISQWENNLQGQQSSFIGSYTNMQGQRKTKFQPVADKALTNAKKAIKNVCGAEVDGGLAAALPGVQTAYENALSQRSTVDYPITQKKAIQNYDDYLKTWHDKLATAIQADKNGDKNALVAFAQAVNNARDDGIRPIIEAYQAHSNSDTDTLNKLRLGEWATAMAKPKRTATQCERENTFGPDVATTWCESSSSPELIIQQAPEPARNKIPVTPVPVPGAPTKPAPTPGIFAPNPIDGGFNETINNRGFVRGQTCSYFPGDPFWKNDCSCNCDDPTCDRSQITRDDVTVTTRAECLWDKQNQGPIPNEFFHDS